MEQLWDWSNVYAIGILGYPISGSERCTYFDKELWFKLGNIMWRKHLILFQEHVKYIHNDILELFRVVILQYAEHTCKIHDQGNYLPPHLMKFGENNQLDWNVRYK